MAYVYNTNIQYMYSAGSGTRWDDSEQRLVWKKIPRGIGTAFIHNDVFSKILGYFDITRFSGDSEYQYRFHQIIGTIFSNEYGMDHMDDILKYCMDNKKFISKLDPEYCYLYSFGYTLGNNLTQQIPFSGDDRINYRKFYLKKWGKGGIDIKDFYLNFTPNKEDL